VKVYRNYELSHVGESYIAKSLDGDATVMISRDPYRIYRAIDMLWTALETGKTPEWLTGTSLDLDQFTVECNASETDPPQHPLRLVVNRATKFVLASAMTSATLAWFHSELAVIFTLVFCTTAVGFDFLPDLGFTAPDTFNLIVSIAAMVMKDKMLSL
jgi:hypothetical protein